MVRLFWTCYFCFQNCGSTKHSKTVLVAEIYGWLKAEDSPRLKRLGLVKKERRKRKRSAYILGEGCILPCLLGKIAETQGIVSAAASSVDRRRERTRLLKHKPSWVCSVVLSIFCQQNIIIMITIEIDLWSLLCKQQTRIKQRVFSGRKTISKLEWWMWIFIPCCLKTSWYCRSSQRVSQVVERLLKYEALFPCWDEKEKSFTQVAWFDKFHLASASHWL